MDYRQAKKIRQRSLSDVIAANLVAGESYTGAIGKGISQKIKAGFTKYKEKFDPLNIAKVMTGGSKLAPALLGRMLGRSKRDIEYFAGTARPIYAPGTAHKISATPGTGDGENIEILSKIYGFMKKTQENEHRRHELKSNREEERQLEEEKRHKELLKALGGKPSATPVGGAPQGKGIFESIIDFFNDLKPMLSFFSDLFTSFKTIGLNVVLRLFAAIGSPAFLAIAAGTALHQLLSKLAEVAPNMKAMSPDEAQSVLQYGTPDQIEKSGGRAHLEDIIKNQRQRAVDASNMPEGEQRDKAIRALGGESKVKGMVADTKVYDVPTQIDKGPEKVGPRPKTGGLALKSKQEDWDRKWSRTHDPETGKRLDLSSLQEAPKTTPTAPATGQKLTTITTENQSLNLPKKPQPDIVTKTLNTINNTKQSSVPLNKLDRLPVRNPDETFQNMIFYSTRVV